MTVAKRRVQEPEVIDLPQLNEDERVAKTDGQSIMGWVGGIAAFFSTARALEQAARQTLERARLLTMPTSADADEEIQRFIKGANTNRREAEAHWEITSRVSQFHKRLVAARKRATEPLEEASTIANRLHNGYSEAEKRRAREEEDRRRREAELQAQRERDADVARLEAEAVAREEASGDLSDRERAFVDFYVNPAMAVERGDAYRAAARAGFKNPQQHAARLISLPKIMDAIKAKQEAIAIREQAAARKEEPLHVDIEPVKPNISRAAGHDRTTWAGEVYDPEAFIAALLDPRTRTQLGIPADCATFVSAKVNEYARSLHEKIDTWPGVRAVKTTKVI